MGRFRILPSFLHLYLRYRISDDVDPIPVLEQLINIYPGVLFFNGRPRDLPSLDLSHRRFIQEDSTGRKLIDRRSQATLENLSYFFAFRLFKAEYRLESDILTYLGVTDAQLKDITSSLDAVHRTLQAQTKNALNGVDIQRAVVISIQCICAELLGRSNASWEVVVSTLNDPTPLPQDIAIEVIETVRTEITNLDKFCTIKPPQ